MNQIFRLSSLSLALLVAAGTATAADFGDISVYGKINASFAKEEGEISANSKTFDSDRWAARSNSSRFGVKGSSKLDQGDLQAVYQLEWGIDTVNDGKGSSNHINSRNQFVGLKSKAAGSLLLGRIDTPLKEAQGKVDLFNDLYGDLQAAIVGENRADHILAYETPKFAESLSGKLAIIPGQDWEYTNATGDIQSGAADGISGSFAFENEQFYASIAADSKVASKLGTDSILPVYGFATTAASGATPASNTVDDYLGIPAGRTKKHVDDLSFLADSVRLTATAKFADLTLGALYQNSQSNSDDKNVKTRDIDADSYLLSAAYALGNTTLKAQYIDSTYDIDNETAKTSSTEDITGWSLGADYKLAKKTKVYAFVTQWDTEHNTWKTDATSTYYGVGLDHSF